MIVVPLIAGAEALGALTLVSADPLRRFDEADASSPRSSGAAPAWRVLNARSSTPSARRSRARCSTACCRPSCPTCPAGPPRSLYRPAGELNEVGGDFYDVFAAPTGWMLVIGDVAGQGAEAATLHRRSPASRCARPAELTGDPARAVARLNDDAARPAGPAAVHGGLRRAATEREDGSARS